VPAVSLVLIKLRWGSDIAKRLSQWLSKDKSLLCPYVIVAAGISNGVYGS
jgi:hypothetical protein